jgi:hypothetical protein
MFNFLKAKPTLDASRPFCRFTLSVLVKHLKGTTACYKRAVECEDLIINTHRKLLEVVVDVTPERAEIHYVTTNASGSEVERKTLRAVRVGDSPTALAQTLWTFYSGRHENATFCKYFKGEMIPTTEERAIDALRIAFTRVSYTITLKDDMLMIDDSPKFVVAS